MSYTYDNVLGGGNQSEWEQYKDLSPSQYENIDRQSKDTSGEVENCRAESNPEGVLAESTSKLELKCIFWDQLPTSSLYQGDALTFLLRAVRKVEIPPGESLYVRTNVHFLGGNSSNRYAEVSSLSKNDHWLAGEIQRFFMIKEGVVDPGYNGLFFACLHNRRSSPTVIQKSCILGKIVIKKCEYTQ